MPRMAVALGLTAMTGVLLAVSLAPAVAQDARSDTRATRELAFQHRPVIVIHPRHRLGPNATRHCQSWLAKRIWPNGQVVITPQMRCWWED